MDCCSSSIAVKKSTIALLPGDLAGCCGVEELDAAGAGIVWDLVGVAEDQTYKSESVASVEFITYTSLPALAGLSCQI